MLEEQNTLETALQWLGNKHKQPGNLVEKFYRPYAIFAIALYNFYGIDVEE